jgi:hypothetical protein
MTSPLTKSPSGSVSWTAKAGDTYLVTGTDRSGRRFRLTCSSWAHASGINLWQGSRWLLRDGRKFRINTTSN